MGFDVSYHPVDRSVIVDRLIPYLRGEGNIDDLIERAVRISKVRYRANAWGLKLLKLQEADSSPEAAGTDSFRGPPRARKPEGPLAGFQADLHLWGRPFLITVSDPVEISKAIDEYLAIDENGVDTIAARMVENLGPGLADKARPADDDFLSVKAKGDLHEQARRPLDELRDVYKASRQGRTITVEDEEVDAQGTFIAAAPLSLLSFYSGLQPGWMARGYTWPTQLLACVGIRFKLFETPAHLIQPLVDEIPPMATSLHNTIVENYMVGGYIRAENVPAWREGLEWAYGRILGAAVKEDDANHCQIVLQKLTEAVADAERRGYSFVEATEVYSGPMGHVN